MYEKVLEVEHFLTVPPLWNEKFSRGQESA